MKVSFKCVYCHKIGCVDERETPTRVLCGQCGCWLNVEQKQSGEIEVTLLPDNP